MYQTSRIGAQNQLGSGTQIKKLYGQLVFVKTNDKSNIKTLSQWSEIVHVFVAIYCQKHPEEVGHLMTCPQIIK